MKVLPFEIPKASNRAILYQVDEGASFYGRLHRHDEIQISLIVKGFGDVIVGNSVHSFESGHIYVIGSNAPHLFRSLDDDGTVHMITLFFTRESFGPAFFQLEEVDHLGRFIDSIHVGLRYTNTPDALQGELATFESLSGTNRMTRFLELLEKLQLLKPERLSRFTSPNISSSEGERMGNVLDYAMNNYTQGVKLNDVASIAHMTPNAFCRYFKTHTNKSFFEFITELRMAHAARLLLEPERTVLEIAYTTGYKNISHFNRTFNKSFGCNPTAYRKRQLLL